MINEYETLFNISLSNQNIYTKTVNIRKEIVEYIFSYLMNTLQRQNYALLGLN